MGGINSLGGLNTINVDFRPAVDPNATRPTGANPPQPAVVPDDGQPPAMAEAKSVVRQLDVLLLSAAGKSVAMDPAKRMKAVGKSLVDKGVLTQKEASRLESLAQDAKEKLKALDRFSGRQLQCDRRASEIYSVTDRMFCLVQKDVVNGTEPDPKVAALLDATFKDLMPREAILAHGTSEALERMKEQMGPTATGARRRASSSADPPARAGPPWRGADPATAALQIFVTIPTGFV